jgi:hypothetical protein
MKNNQKELAIRSFTYHTINVGLMVIESLYYLRYGTYDWNSTYDRSKDKDAENG